MPYSWIFIVFFLLETVSVVLFTSWLGGLPTVILMVLFFLLGFFMLRHIGISALLLFIDVVRNRTGDVSPYQMLWPVRYGMAALCFMLPGFFSDLIGLILLLPFKGKPTNFTQRTARDDVIDGEYNEVTPDQPSDNATSRIRHTK